MDESLLRPLDKQIFNVVAINLIRELFVAILMSLSSIRISKCAS